MVRANKDMLENGVEGAKGSEMLEVENLVHSIINSYYYVLLQQEMLGVAKTVVEISYDRLLKEKSAMEIGSSGNYEYLLAQKAYLNDKSSYMTQDKSLRDAIRNLNLLLASEPSKMWKLTETITAPKGGYSFNAMEEQMLKDNRTLNNQYINVRARDIAISQQKSALYPAIGMYGSIAAGNIGFQNSNPKTNFVQPSIGLTLSYNLFNGGRVRRSIDVAKLNREIAQKGSEQIKLTLKNELTTQYDNFEMFSELVKLDKEQLDVAKELLEITEEKYKSGVLSSFDFREIQLTYMISASSYLQSIYNLVAADCQLLKLTGGILSYQEPAE